MNAAASPKIFRRDYLPLALVGTVLFTGLSGCGSDTGRFGDAASALDGTNGPDAPLANDASRWPAELTVSTCEDFDNVNVGAYSVQTNYWNKSACPGTQCLDINKATGAFTVTQGPTACGNTVSTYPNVLYGCSFGNCSPASLLPMKVDAVSTATSSWDFSVGGAASDRYNVAYDIWFCPDDSCGNNGFPGGLEIMIWLDHKNVNGWQTKLGTVALAGHTWDVWRSTMGSGANAWTDLTYIITSPMVTSVTDMDLNAFFKDAAARGSVKSSWYLYAIQAGTELRTGGVPFTNNSFSVAINGVVPSTNTVDAGQGPACNGGMPTAEGKLAVSNSYVTTGPLHGYGSAWSWVGPTSKASVCVTPTCNAGADLLAGSNGTAPLTAEPVACVPAFASSALCTSGTVTGDLSYLQLAGLGFNFNQGARASTTVDAGAGLDGGAIDAGTVDGDGGSAVGTIVIPKSITVSVDKFGTLPGNTALRVQLTDKDNNSYCYGGKLVSGTPIPIDQFNETCWNNKGKFATATTAIKRADVLVPGAASGDLPFSFCLTNVSVE
jgi:cellulose 1,4-beta-cellobiosidase